MPKTTARSLEATTYTRQEFLEDCRMIAETCGGRIETSIPNNFDLSALASGFAAGRARENEVFNSLLKIYRKFQNRYDGAQAHRRFVWYLLINQLIDHRRDDLINAGLARRSRGTVSVEDRVLAALFELGRIEPNGTGWYRIVNGGDLIDQIIDIAGAQEIPTG